MTIPYPKGTYQFKVNNKGTREITGDVMVVFLLRFWSFVCPVYKNMFNPLSASVALIETSQLICTANQLTGFCMRATLALNGLMIMKDDMLHHSEIYFYYI